MLDKQEILQFAPSIVGSAGALAWIRGTLPRKITMLLLGIAASHWGTPDVSTWLNLNDGLVGFLIGMFSMTAADWIFRTWDVFGFMLVDWARMRLGLPERKCDK